MKNEERGEADVTVQQAPVVDSVVAPVPQKKAKGDTFVRVTKSIGSVLMGITFLAMIAAVIFLVTRCENSTKASGSELIHAENVVSKAAHQLILRNDAAANPMAVVGPSGTGLVTFVTPTVTVGNLGEATTSSTTVTPVVGVSVPISTQTALSTIYSFWTSDVTDFVTMTTTSTTTVTRPVSKNPEEDAVCVATTATMTVSVYLTLSPVPDETVTGDASTVTDVSTDLYLTHSLPDVTLSGNPSTQTEVQTQVSLTTGLPDATVSGDGETKTAVQTDLSLTSGLPDATVTGSPSTVSNVISSTISQSVVSIFTTVVITDFWGTFNPSSQTSTTTATASSEATLTLTVTVSDLEQKDITSAPASASSSILADLTSESSSNYGGTKTVTMTWTGGAPLATSLYTTIRYPPVTNATTGGGAAWTSAAGEPVVVSDGATKPKPKGSGTLSCTVMLMAIIMLVL
ncbi:hypothetical protein L249_2126 [Ophiocordyceps polyrhachis-furcata BCC 54312]|uniref:Uncharacterized protein n=1 Tax=Ophiocordyceps polyrhachis-furcata BCC 54312 TaxID=1330021 RepID=A0A367LRL2_9HYPO|nr:hypothetical protein L249_2126 [Ophiocordyceps polyrhachis-furcata BCC 54312]